MFSAKMLPLRRVAALLLALALLVGCAACAAPQPSSSSAVTTAAASSAPAASESAAATPVASAAAGDNFNAAGYPIFKQTVTLGVTGDKDATPDWNDTVLVQEIEKRLGIKLDCKPVDHDSWKTQLTLMMSTNALPDIVANAGMTLVELAQYGSQGYLLPMNQYVDTYAPNLKGYLDKFTNFKGAVTSPDGNIYGLVRFTPDTPIAQVSRTWLNKSWLDNLKLSAPKTVDELYNILVAFRDKDANGNGDATDELPFSTVFNQGNYANRMLLSAFGIQTSAENYILQATDGKIGIAETTDNYKAYLRFMNKLYKEKLLDQESFVQTGDEFRAKQAAGRVGVFGEAAPFVGAGKDLSYDTGFLWLGALTSESNSTPTVPMDSPVGTGVLVALSAKTAYPEAAVRFVDYLYTSEGAMAARRGFEGMTFDWKAIEGMDGSKVAEMRKPEGYDSNEKYRYTKAVINNAFFLLSLSEGSQYKVIQGATADQLDNILLPLYGWAVLIQKDALNRSDAKQVDTLPAFTYTAEESQTATALQNDVKLYLQNAAAQFITGEVDIDKGWDNHLKTLDQIGLTKLLAIEQAAYDRMKK